MAIARALVKDAPTRCCWTSRWPISTTSCARSCATNCRASSRTGVHLRLRDDRADGGAAAWRQHGCHVVRAESLQYRPDAPKVYRAPDDLRVAQVFSDPPLNMIVVHERGRRRSHLPADLVMPLAGLGPRPIPDGPYRVGFRAHQLLSAAASPATRVCQVTVDRDEITGSETTSCISARRPSNGRCAAGACTNVTIGRAISSTLGSTRHSTCSTPHDRLVAAAKRNGEGDPTWPALTSSISRTLRRQ